MYLKVCPDLKVDNFLFKVTFCNSTHIAFTLILRIFNIKFNILLIQSYNKFYLCNVKYLQTCFFFVWKFFKCLVKLVRRFTSSFFNFKLILAVHKKSSCVKQVHDLTQLFDLNFWSFFQKKNNGLRKYI